MPQINFDYRPIPVHADFHVSRSPERFLFGAFGSGKSWALCAEAIAWCLEFPGIRGLIARKTVPELRDTTEQVFFEILPHELFMAGEVRRTGGHVESFMFPNGSKVLFRAIDEWQKLKSLNIGFAAFDEADEFDEETYQGMLSRVRQREPTPEAAALGAGDIGRRGVWSASNPAGHNWLWRRSVNDDTRIEDAAYFKSTSFDNPYLPQEYFDYLLGYPKEWVKRYVLCQFDEFAGQVYPEWGWDSHVVKNLKLQGQEVYWMGMDPGTRNPTAGLWVVLDQTGEISGHRRSLIGVAEYAEHSTSAVDHAKAWRLIESQNKMKVTKRIADPNIETRDRGTNMKLSDQYRRLGFRFDLGPRRHSDRIPALGQLIASRRFLLTENCPMAFDQIQNYQWEDMTSAMKAKGRDAPETVLKANDHIVDCGQYVASKFITPWKPKEHELHLTLGQEVSRNIKRSLKSRSTASMPDGMVY